MTTSVPQLPATALTPVLSLVPPGGRLIRASELRARPEPVWLVDKTIPSTGVGQLYGPTYSGKSFVALDLALSVANGKAEWFGHALAARCPVVYVLMEGSFDFGLRIAAWLKVNGGSDDGLYVLDEQDVNLADPGSLGRIVADIRAAEIAPALVIIDTQALATAGTEENSNRDMGLVFANLKRLSRELGAFVMTVHHTGYDTTHSRGASAQKAALDVEMAIRDGVLTAPKVKAGRPWTEGEPFRVMAAGASAVITRELSVLDVVSAKPGRTITEITKLLGRRRAAVLDELNELVEEGGVHICPEGQRKGYHPGPADD